MNVDKANSEAYSELILTAELNLNIDESVNKYKKLKKNVNDVEKSLSLSNYLTNILELMKTVQHITNLTT